MHQTKISLVVLLVLGLCRVGHHALIDMKGVVTANRNGGYVYVGDVLQLNCTVNDTENWQAEDLTFSHENDFDTYESRDVPQQQLTIISNRTLQLNRRIAGKEDAGEYMCWIKMPPSAEVVNSLVVTVQYRPQNVDVHCFASDWDESLTCVLKYGVPYINNSDVSNLRHPDVTVEVNLIQRYSRVGCPQPISPLEETSQCVWDHSKFRAATGYLLQVVVKNEITGDRNRTRLCIDTNRIVKPSAVNNIHVKEENSTCVTLAWSHERVHREKYYRVNISNGQSQFVDSAVAQFCGLLPYTQYRVSVECHANSSKHQALCLRNSGGDVDGFWSEARTKTVVTAESVPDSSFAIHEGGYMLGPCDEKNGTRDVTVFMNAVPPDQRNGRIIGYQYMYNGISEDVNVSSPTSALIPNVACYSNFSLRIFSRTKVGSSKTNAQLHIFSGDEQSVSGFAVEVQQGQLVAVWGNSSGVDDEDNVTVFWCPKDQTKPDKMCQGEIKWVSAPFSDGQVEIPQFLSLDHQSSPYTFLYGASRNGHAITWTDCLFDRQAKMRQPKVRVNPVSEQLDIQWSIQRCSETYRVHTTATILHYCHVLDCPNSAKSVKLKGTEIKNYTLRGEPGLKYNITVQAQDYWGRKGPLSEPQVTAIPTPHEFTQWWVIILSLGVAIVVILCCAAGYRICRKVKMEKEKFNSSGLPGHMPRSVIAEQGQYTPVDLDSPSHRPQTTGYSNSHSTMYTDLSVPRLQGENSGEPDEGVGGQLGGEDCQPCPLYDLPSNPPQQSRAVPAGYTGHAHFGQDFRTLSSPAEIPSNIDMTDSGAHHPAFLPSSTVHPAESSVMPTNKGDMPYVTCAPETPSVVGDPQIQTSLADDELQPGSCAGKQDMAASTPSSLGPMPVTSSEDDGPFGQETDEPDTCPSSDSALPEDAACCAVKEPPVQSVMVSSYVRVPDVMGDPTSPTQRSTLKENQRPCTKPETLQNSVHAVSGVAEQGMGDTAVAGREPEDKHTSSLPGQTSRTDLLQGSASAQPAGYISYDSYELQPVVFHSNSPEDDDSQEVILPLYMQARVSAGADK